MEYWGEAVKNQILPALQPKNQGNTHQMVTNPTKMLHKP
jgi:hypothetical protein